MLSLKGHKMTVFSVTLSCGKLSSRSFLMRRKQNQKRNWIATSNNNSLRRRNKDECGERERDG